MRQEVKDAISFLYSDAVGPMTISQVRDEIRRRWGDDVEMELKQLVDDVCTDNDQ